MNTYFMYLLLLSGLSARVEQVATHVANISMHVRLTLNV